MDGQNTVEPQKNDEPTERTPLDVEHELKFTGFEQPKEKGFWFFIKRHKLRTALASFGLIIVICVGSLVAVSSGGEDTQTAQQPQSQNVTESTDQTDEDQIEDPQTSAIPEVTKAEYSLNTNGEYYELVSEGQVWLTRSEQSWNESVSWNNWLFFLSDLGDNVDENGVYMGGLIGVEAFNYETKEYLTIAKIEHSQLATFDAPLYIQDEHLYVGIRAHNNAAKTWRCLLDEQKSCSDMNLFYEGQGRLTVINESTVIAHYDTGQVADRFQSLTVFNPMDSTKKEIAKLNSKHSVGSELATIAEDALIWIAEVSGNEAQAADPNYTGKKLERVYAVDTNGETKFVLPGAAFPILDSMLLRDNSSSNITFVNDSQQVVFDTDKKEFGAAKARKTAANGGEKTQIRKLLEISTRLEIPAALTLRAAE